jgi:hypothetical protein
VAEAAEFLGISAEAVRGRVRRGTLPVEREGGTVYVLLDRPAPDRTTDDQPRTTTDRTELVEELRDRIRYLERQVEQANERDSENRRVILALTSRIPELQAAPPEATGGPQPVEEPERGTAPGTPAGPERRPWWRRLWR